MRVLVVGFWLLVASAAAAAEALIRLTHEQTAHAGIRTALAEPVAAMPLARAPGRVVLPPAEEFAVSALQGGFISRVNVPVGATVSKGQTLAEIRSNTLLEVQRALLDAVSKLNVAQAKSNRDQTLLREGIISRLRWQETKSDFDQAQAALHEAEQTLANSGASPADIERLKTSRRLDAILKIRAPADGIVLERLAVVGQKVDALTPLFRVGKLDQLWLELNVPQERLHEAKIGDRVTVEDPKATARIIEIGQSVDPKSQSALVRAVVEQHGGKLLPGMNINVQLMHRSTDAILRVPAAAVFAHQGRQYVFVKTGEGYEAREILVAGQEIYRVVVHEGLKPGEDIVIQGVAALKAAWLGIGGD
jgi:cobalt-zinc-cadmium efflux system membrane fusion protein